MGVFPPALPLVTPRVEAVSAWVSPCVRCSISRSRCCAPFSRPQKNFLPKRALVLSMAERTILVLLLSRVFALRVAALLFFRGCLLPCSGVPSSRNDAPLDSPCG